MASGDGPIKSDFCIGTSASQRGIFGQKSVTGMNRVTSGITRGADDFLYDEIAFARGAGRRRSPTVCKAHMERSTVGVAINRHSKRAEVSTGS